MDRYTVLYERIRDIKAINTHCHHYRNDFFVNLNLKRLLRDTYVNWCGISFNDSKESKQKYLLKIKYNSYFVWLQKSIKEIYEIEEELTVDNWYLYSEKINNAHKNINWHKNILKEICKYKRIILDTRWDPGSNNDEPEMFSSTFRVDPLFFGFNKNAYDHDNNNTYKFYKKDFNNIDSYLEFVEKLIIEKVRKGCVSIKCAIAYDRSLDFIMTTKENANKVFISQDYTAEDVKNFQDYLFYKICRIAAELDIPIQCHTGLGCLIGTNAMSLYEVIEQNPKTKFVLFHGGFPWTHDILALLHSFPNVYSDLCWLPLISPNMAESFLHQLIEVGTSEKICWGCDTWTSEESYGARIAINTVLTNVFTEKINKGYLNRKDAEYFAKNILYDNPKKLYRL